MAATEDQTHLLQSGDHLKLLDEIDKLRSQGISHYVSLPQLIVCGDQSSGKSSVLEAISGISFPTKDTLCTRFATEVILRKAAATSVSVRIVPSQTRTEADCKGLAEFCEILADLLEFPAVVDKAKAAMGLSATTSAFANDVLRVEISGPDRPSLTIVDLPGLIHSENKVQSAADVTLVSKIVRGYMQNPRSIILAIVSAKNDYANQVVLKLAKDADPLGYRTLGIITKPDTLSVGSESEAAFVELARNDDVTFRLGWHLLRNRSYETREDSSEERNATETAFFSQGVWKDLPRAMVGISPLQARLSKVLLNQIRAELPALVEDIERGVQETANKLNKLGEKRATVGEQRLFLLRIGQAFQALVKAAVDGTYVDPFFGEVSSKDSESRRLRAVVQNLNLDFAEQMRMHGQHRSILDPQKYSVPQDIRQSNAKAITRDAFENEIVDLLKRNRGRELPGMFNPMIVGEMFHQQSQPWEGKARTHIKNICDAVETFLEQTLTYLTDENTSLNVLRDVVGPQITDRSKEINNKLDEILMPFTRGHPITYNHYFTETIQEIRQERLENDITDRLHKLSPSMFDGEGDNDEPVAITIGGNVTVSELISALSSRNETDMDKYAASEILLCMEAYYKVALKVFVDNVAAQAVEACILVRLSEILSPTSILEMEADLITAIAMEPEESQMEREQLNRKLSVLRSGLEICKRYASRPKRIAAHAKTASKSTTPFPDFAAPENAVENSLASTPKPTSKNKGNGRLPSTSSGIVGSTLFGPQPKPSPTPPPSVTPTPPPPVTQPQGSGLLFKPFGAPAAPSPEQPAQSSSLFGNQPPSTDPNAALTSLFAPRAQGSQSTGAFGSSTNSSGNAFGGGGGSLFSFPSQGNQGKK